MIAAVIAAVQRLLQMAAHQRSDVSSCGPLGWGCDAESVLGVAVDWNAGTSCAGVVSITSAQMMGQPKKEGEKTATETNKQSKKAELRLGQYSAALSCLFVYARYALRQPKDAVMLL